MDKSTLTASQAQGLARLTGFFYLLIFGFAIFANMVAIGGLVVDGDPAATTANLMENLGQFRLGAAAFVIVLIADVIISWSLYYLLIPAGRKLSLLSALFRLVYTVMFAAVALEFVHILKIVEAGDALSPVNAQAEIYLALKSYGSGFAVSLVFFGIHIFLLGLLLVRAAYLPALLGILLFLAGAGYIVDGMGTLLFADYGPFAKIISMMVILPALVGEGTLTLWLLIRGLNPKKWPEVS
ncbi:DUF4386 domain-containing protein [Parvularcula marina]|uniref:DUF4386 domain-containing protein n=1 Tax=Parvularcula marina TaxID=2292771 RepID=UPI003510D8F5